MEIVLFQNVMFAAIKIRPTKAKVLTDAEVQPTITYRRLV